MKKISDLCTFWDLHVAIQNAMSWTDSHLHHFEMKHSKQKDKVHFGIPTDDDDDILDTQAGWEHKIRDYYSKNAPTAE